MTKITIITNGNHVKSEPAVIALKKKGRIAVLSIQLCRFADKHGSATNLYHSPVIERQDKLLKISMTNK